MADNIYNINLDVDKKFNLINDVVVMRQGETGVKIVAKLFNHNKDFGTISKATFSCVKPDGHVVIDDSATVSGSTITYTLNQQVGAVSGDIETAYFTINGSVTTSNITIRVISDADSSLGSSDYVNGIDSLKDDLAKKLKDVTDEYNKKYSDILTQIKNIDVSDELTKALADLTAKYDVKIQELLGMINDIDISDELHKAIQEQLDAVKAEFNAAVKNANDNANTKLDQLIKLIETVQSKIDLANQKIKDADTALSNLATEVTKIDGFLDQQHKLIWDNYIKYRNTLQVDFDSFKDSITASVSTLTTDISELQARADKISEELQSVDLTLMQKNRTDIDRLEPVINTAIQTATVNGETVEKSGTELTITVPDPDLSGYAKSSDIEKLKPTVDSAVQTATVNGEEVTKKGTQLEIEVPDPDLSQLDDLTDAVFHTNNLVTDPEFLDIENNLTMWDSTNKPTLAPLKFGAHNMLLLPKGGPSFMYGKEFDITNVDQLNLSLYYYRLTPSANLSIGFALKKKDGTYTTAQRDNISYDAKKFMKFSYTNTSPLSNYVGAKLYFISFGTDPIYITMPQINVGEESLTYRSESISDELIDFYSDDFKKKQELQSEIDDLINRITKLEGGTK